MHELSYSTISITVIVFHVTFPQVFCSAFSSVSHVEGLQDRVHSSWRLGKLNHVAIAVPNLEEATKLYHDVLGASVSGVTVT